MKNKKNVKKKIFIFVIFNCIFITNLLAVEDINYLSLKNNEVNLRQGPSKEYPIKLIYKKKYLPLQVLDKSETWRKVMDFENNSGWIHISQLTNKKSAINISNNSILRKKPTIYSKPIAKLEPGRLVLIKKCKIKWCKIISGDFNGWIFKSSLWGKTN
jgi:SH3-like domain-containing protein